jgi:hypothetical protein
MQLKLISAQPATQYYAWQVEVYLTQFLRLGYSAEDIHVVGGFTENQSVDISWMKLKDKFKDVHFAFYKYTQTNYAPAMQSEVLAKHWLSNEYLKDCAVFFHDADFLFTKYFDFTEYLRDNTWYFSDTISYIGADYIKSKSTSILDIMCQTVGIDKSLVESNQQNSGGAQKLMKNVTFDYWQEVNSHSVNLYNLLSRLSYIKPEGHQYGIQVWTASMWAELWTAWKRGYTVEVPKEFDFSWATCHSDRWDEKSFFHNAGVSSEGRGMFFKGAYIDNLPYGTDLDLSKDHCSYNYYEIIKSIDTCLI